MSPFFLLSSGRSGSTLLASMLDMHSALHMPVELIGLYSSLPLRLPLYGDLARPGNRRLLVRDLCAVGQLREFGVALDTPALDARIAASDGTQGGVLRAFYETLLADTGKRRLGDKTPNHLPHVDRIARLFPQAPFIHLVRDGRDVALSLMASRQGINRRNLFELAALWRRNNLKAAAAGARHRGRYLLVRYEDLVADPASVLDRICAMLEEPFEPSMLEYHTGTFASDNARRLAHHENLGRNLMRDNTEKWRNQLGARDLALYERLAGGALEAFGYPLGAPGGRHVGRGALALRGAGLAAATGAKLSLRGIHTLRVQARWTAATLAKRALAGRSNRQANAG